MVTTPIRFWNPYAVGAGIGLISILSFIFSNRPIGCSTAFVELLGKVEELFGRDFLENSYYKKYTPGFGWEFFFLAGILSGGFLSSFFLRDAFTTKIPVMWESRFGSNIFLRQVSAVVGGIMLGFGSRLAGGCVSGHGIGGTQQNALSSWLSVIFFFTGAVSMAFLIYGVF